MKVKIGTTVYDSETEPIMLVLSDHEKECISNMEKECYKFCSFPKTYVDDIAIKEFMNFTESKSIRVTEG